MHISLTLNIHISITLNIHISLTLNIHISITLNMHISITLNIHISLALNSYLTHSKYSHFTPTGRAESALNAKIAQYDEDMNARQKSLDELKSCYSSEAAEYAILKGTYV